jgi:cytochrome c-type biogenesis protein CcmH
MSLREIADKGYLLRGEERMSLFFTFGVMTLIAVLAVLLPLGRRRHRVAMSDVDVYRAQLAEVDRARETGSVGPDEGLGLRTEVARRLIAAADRPSTDSSAAPVSGTTWRRRAVTLVAVLLLPAAAAAIYVALGNPGLPDQPRAARLAPAPDGTAQLLARVEAVLKTRPDDGRGWDLLAPIYLRIGRAQDAATAYGNAIRLLGSTPEREAGHGEALTLSSGGMVPPDAVAAFERAVAADAANPRARYFLAKARAQNGDRAGALADLRELVAEAPADAPWRAYVERAVKELEDGAS